jgi:two-component sensor histidine kinase
MNAFWNRISKIGISSNLKISDKEIKRMMFFNQVLFVGLTMTFFQIIMVWPFIKWSALVFLFVPFISLVCILLNSKGKFIFSKWLFTITVYSLGVITAIMLGGSGLYHVLVLLTYIFGLILFNPKKELIAHVIGVLIVLFVLFIGEMNWLGSPDFSDHSWNVYFRWGNLVSLLVASTLMINFILKLNRQTEKELLLIASEKEIIVQKVKIQASALEAQKVSLEDLVKQRTEKISTQKEALEIQNREKEVLLQEVHHRVKNNLQIIVSLINLQRHKYEALETQESLKEIQSRVLSMSLVHRKMYENSDCLEINLSDYCNQLVENIQLLYDEKPFKFDSDIPKDIMLDMDSAIPLGLIFNEIVINFYKHAYSKLNASKFSLHFKKDNGFYHFKCADNGIGFPKNFQNENSGSIGLEVIEGLVEQIDGTCRFYNDGGAVYEFSMVMNKKKVLV